MSTTFKTPLNNIRTTLQSSHTSGSGSLAVATGTGTLFGSTFPLRVTVITAQSYGSSAEALTIFSVTARATDTLTVTAIEGTADATYAAGAFVEMRDTAGTFSDIHTAVNALETNISAGRCPLCNVERGDFVFRDRHGRDGGKGIDGQWEWGRSYIPGDSQRDLCDCGVWLDTIRSHNELRKCWAQHFPACRRRLHDLRDRSLPDGI